MITYDRTGDTDVHAFERDERGNLKPIETQQTYPSQILEEDGQIRDIIPPRAPNYERLVKLDRALELQRTIEDCIEQMQNDENDSAGYQEKIYYLEQQRDAILSELGITMEKVRDERQRAEGGRTPGEDAEERRLSRY